MTGKGKYDPKQIALQIAELWGGIEEEQLSLLKEHIKISKFKKNDSIYKNEGTPTDAMCLISGKVKIYKEGIGGKSQIIRVIKPIEFFGFRAYFAHEIYKTAAMALDDCVIAHFPMSVLMKMLAKNFNIAFFFIRYLSVEIGKSDDRTVNLTQKHIRARLAEGLTFLKNSYGMENDGQTLDIQLSREDLANLCNMTTSNAIRTLSTFATEGLVKLSGRKIKLLDEEEILRIAELG